MYFPLPAAWQMLTDCPRWASGSCLIEPGPREPCGQPGDEHGDEREDGGSPITNFI